MDRERSIESNGRHNSTATFLHMCVPLYRDEIKYVCVHRCANNHEYVYSVIVIEARNAAASSAVNRWLLLQRVHSHRKKNSISSKKKAFNLS